MDKKTTDIRVEQFSLLCDWMWRNVVAPDWPEDGLRHTSANCREMADEVMDMLGLDQPTREDLGNADPEWRARLEALGRWDDDEPDGHGAVRLH